MAILDRFRKQAAAPAEEGAAKAPKAAKKPAAKKAPAKKKAAEKTEAVVGAVASGDALSPRLLLKPHVSEKAARLADKGTYVFDVAVSAEKIAIKKAVEAMYNVHVDSVRTIRGEGKPVYRGYGGRRNRWKKALVTVKKGERIDLYEGV